MATLFPEDPQLLRFTQRFAGPTFDPTTVRPIISPRTQMRPVMPAIIASIEEPLPAIPPQIIAEQQRIASPGITNSPHLANLLPVGQSPKRPLEDADDVVQPRKLARGESPLKGAAGRRLDAARRNLATSGNTPTSLPQGVNFLLGIIPGAHTYKETRFKADGIVNLLRNAAGIPLPGAPLPPAPQRWGTTPTTAQQLASIQEKYGNPGIGLPPMPGQHAWGA